MIISWKKYDSKKFQTTYLAKNKKSRTEFSSICSNIEHLLWNNSLSYCIKILTELQGVQMCYFESNIYTATDHTLLLYP